MYKTSWCDSPHIYIRQLGSIRRKHIGCILEKSLADLQMPSHLWLKKKKKQIKLYTFHLKCVLFLFFFSCCLSTVVSIFLPPLPPPHPSPPPTLNSTPLRLCTCVLYRCSLTTLPLLYPVMPLPPPLWLLSVCF